MGKAVRTPRRPRTVRDRHRSWVTRRGTRPPTEAWTEERAAVSTENEGNPVPPAPSAPPVPPSGSPAPAPHSQAAGPAQGETLPPRPDTPPRAGRRRRLRRARTRRTRTPTRPTREPSLRTAPPAGTRKRRSDGPRCWRPAAHPVHPAPTSTPRAPPRPPRASPRPAATRTRRRTPPYRRPSAPGPRRPLRRSPPTRTPHGAGGWGAAYESAEHKPRGGRRGGLLAAVTARRSSAGALGGGVGYWAAERNDESVDSTTVSASDTPRT